MAANMSSTLHYAAGIPVPGCQQLRKNLVTKTLKTTTIASNNPAMPSETSSLVSMPSQLQRNSVCSRRNKSVVAAYPDLKIEVKTIITPGVPEYTSIEIYNSSGQTLKIDDKYFWAGSQNPEIPKEIKDRETISFDHKAGSDGSIGAIEYVFPGDKYKLILAWSNARDDLNKVYTVILPDDANWNHIKERLDLAGQESIFYKPSKIPYSSRVKIDKTSSTPKMLVTVGKESPIEPTEFIKLPSKTISNVSNVGGEPSTGNVNGAQPEVPEVVDEGNGAQPEVPEVVDEGNGAQPEAQETETSPTPAGV